jgi:hypothetical protein
VQTLSGGSDGSPISEASVFSKEKNIIYENVWHEKRNMLTVSRKQYADLLPAA